MLHVCVFFVISMDMLLFSFIIIEKVYLKNDVVLSLCKRYIMKTSSNLAASVATNVKIANKTAPSPNHIKYHHPPPPPQYSLFLHNNPVDHELSFGCIKIATVLFHLSF